MKIKLDGYICGIGSILNESKNKTTTVTIQTPIGCLLLPIEDKDADEFWLKAPQHTEVTITSEIEFK